jgi:alpha-tubulin suppressor-like RCC1 family protein
LINVNGKHLVSASVNSSSNCIVITPQNHLKQGSNFYVHIDSGAIKSELGQWFEGFTSDGDWSFKTQPQKPINLLAGGFKFLLNIQDKKVFSMGRDERDQLGRNGKNDTLLKVTIEGDPDIIDIDCGAQHSIARTASGNMVIWGGDDFGQSLENLQVVDQLGKIIDISCGAYSSYALNDLGQLWARGRNHLGQLGIKGKNIKRQWTQVTSSPSTEKMIKVSSGIEHLLILCASGNLYGTGSNGFGQLGLKGKSKTNTIHLLDSNSQFIDVEAGGFHSLALTKNGNVCAFGRNDQGQLGLGYASEPVNEIGHLLNIGNVTKLSGGYLHSIFFQKQASGNLCYGSGSNRNQQLSNGSVKKIYRPKLIASGVHDVSTGSHCSIFLYENNHLEKRGEWK